MIGYSEDIIPSIMLQYRISFGILHTQEEPKIVIIREMIQAIYGFMILDIRA
jgi:hypothetical protein